MRTGAWFRDNAAGLAFFGYAFFASPWLGRALQRGVRESEPLVLAGLVVLAAGALEPLGLHWKCLFLRRRNRDEGWTPQGPATMLASTTAIGHMVVSFLLGMLAMDCLGANENWAAAGGLAFVLKDFIALIASGGETVASEPPGHWKEKAGDGLLLAFGCVAYTAWWQGVFDLGEIRGESLGMKIALGVLLGGVFLLFYLPMRLPFVLEELHLRPARGRRVRVAAEMAAGALLGFYPAFF